VGAAGAAGVTAVLVEGGVDAGLVWHYGDPLGEQRALVASGGMADPPNRDLVVVTGPDRSRYLDLMTTQRFADLGPGETRSAYFLDAQGHILYSIAATETGDAIRAWTERGRGPALAAWLEQMKFRLDVTARAADPPDTTTPSGAPIGVWAAEALRIAAGTPRIGVDTDARTIPNELGVPSAAVALDKGCYPGQETVARVYNVGRPPRRLVRLHLDGSADLFPAHGTDLRGGDGVTVGFLGSMAYHYELGPIGLGLVKVDYEGDVVTLNDVPATVEHLVELPEHEELKAAVRSLRRRGLSA
jgi:folate-binding protein YgfZ